MKKKPKEKIRLLLVDDHPIVLEGLRSYLSLQARVLIVGEASNGSDAITKAMELFPDVIVMDISMPKMNGIETTRALVRKNSLVKILILSAYDTNEYILPAIRAGAKGYILKDAPPSELLRAIEVVFHGDFFFGHVASQALFNAYVRGDQTPDVPELSAREIEVLMLTAEGKSVKEIAAHLFISLRTVETHRERIMKKLNIHSAAGLVKYAVAKGLVHF